MVENAARKVKALILIKEYIKAVRWQFAKSMPESPHEYTVVDWFPYKRRTFEAFVLYIRKNGYKKMYNGLTYMYFDVDEYSYWTMGAPIDKTILINRARKNG